MDEFVLCANDQDMDKLNESDLENCKMLKTQEKMFGVQLAKDADQLVVTWYGEKIIVPCKDELNRDLRQYIRQLNIICYPILLSDLYHSHVAKVLQKAVNVSMEIDECSEGGPSKGFLRLKFIRMADVEEAKEILKEIPSLSKGSKSSVIQRDNKNDGEGVGGTSREARRERQISVLTYSEETFEGDILEQVKGRLEKGQLAERILFVGNLGVEEGEEELKKLFEDSVAVIVPKKKNISEKKYAYIEYSSKSEAKKALNNYRNCLLGNRKLFVIQALNEKKAELGVLEDHMRKHWISQIETLKTKDQTLMNTSDALEIQQKLLRYKKRVINDNIRKVDMGFPIPQEEKLELTEAEKETIRKDREKEKEKQKQKEKEKEEENKRKKKSPNHHHYLSQHRDSKKRTPRGGAHSTRYVPETMVYDQINRIVGVISSKVAAQVAPKASALATSAANDSYLFQSNPFQGNSYNNHYGNERSTEAQGFGTSYNSSFSQNRTAESRYDSSYNQFGTEKRRKYPSKIGNYPHHQNLYYRKM